MRACFLVGSGAERRRI